MQNNPEWRDDWLTYLDSNIVREKSRQDYDRRVRNLLELDMPVDKYILQPYDAATGDGWSERNVRRAAMVHFRRFCHRHKIHGFFPPEFEMPKSIPARARKPVYLSQEEQLVFLEMVLAGHGWREYTFLLLAYSLGLRAAELRMLRLCDVRLDCDKPHVYVVNGKGGKDGNVYMDNYTQTRLREYLEQRLIFGSEPEGWLFLGDRLGQYPKDCRRAIDAERAVFEKLGFPQPARPLHNHRHMRCTHLKEMGMNDIDNQHFMRHKNLTTTQLYMHLNEARLAVEMEKFSPFTETAAQMLKEPRRIDVIHWPDMEEFFTEKELIRGGRKRTKRQESIDRKLALVGLFKGKFGALPMEDAI